jgi:hypothetical protein
MVIKYIASLSQRGRQGVFYRSNDFTSLRYAWVGGGEGVSTLWDGGSSRASFLVNRMRMRSIATVKVKIVCYTGKQTFKAVLKIQARTESETFALVNSEHFFLIRLRSRVQQFSHQKMYGLGTFSYKK